MANRTFCWLEFGVRRQAVNSFAWAAALHPKNAFLAYRLYHEYVSWGEELQKLQPPGFPKMNIHWPPRRFPTTFSEAAERKILCMEAWENILKDQEMNRLWWEPTRCGWPLPRRPVRANVACKTTGCDISFEFSRIN